MNHAAATSPVRVSTDISLRKQNYNDCYHFCNRTPDLKKSVVLTAVPKFGGASNHLTNNCRYVGHKGGHQAVLIDKRTSNRRTVHLNSHGFKILTSSRNLSEYRQHLVGLPKELLLEM